jgi:hypothetical protein
MSLWDHGRQIGSYHLDTKVYFKLQGNQFVVSQCPVDPPQESPPEAPKAKEANEIKQTAKATKKPDPEPLNYGLDKNEIPQDVELYLYNGQSIDKEAAEGLLGGKLSDDRLVDDSKALRLTIVGTGGKKLLEKIKQDPAWPEYSESILAKDYPADHWSLAGKGYKQLSTSGPTIYLTTAEGTTLYSGEDVGGLFDALKRKRDPYSISWSSKWLGFNPFTWMVGFGWSSLHIPIEWVLGVIAAVVVAVLVLRRKPGPPQRAA